MADIGELIGDSGSGLVDKVKSIPPMAWVIGIGVLLAVFLLSRGGGGGSTATGNELDDTGTGGDGGDFSPDINQELSSLFDIVRQNATDQAAFRSELDTWMKSNGTPSTGGSGITAAGGPRPSSRATAPSNIPTATVKSPVTALTPAPAGRVRP